MGEDLGAIIGAAGAVGSGLLNFGSNFFTNAASSKENARNRSFQERMSNTAHQREVRDLLSAGINPMLTLGAGASSPSGGVPQLTSPHMDNLSESIYNNLVKDASLDNLVSQNDVLNKQVDNLESQIRSTNADVALKMQRLKEGAFVSSVNSDINDAYQSVKNSALRTFSVYKRNLGVIFRDPKDAWDKYGYRNYIKR